MRILRRAEYLAVMSGQADEELRLGFVQALRDHDPELKAILAENRRRSIALFQPSSIVPSPGLPFPIAPEN